MTHESSDDKDKRIAELEAKVEKLESAARINWDKFNYTELEQENDQLQSKLDKAIKGLESIETLMTPFGPWTALECFAKCQSNARQTLAELRDDEKEA